MFDPSMIDSSHAIASKTLLADPSLTLAGCKSYLHANGFDSGFGEPATVEKFQQFVDSQTAHGTYAGKSIKLGEGGRAAILKHKLIIIGKYGSSLKDIPDKAWEDMNTVSRINYLNKYGSET